MRSHFRFFHDADMPKINHIRIIEPSLAANAAPATFDADLEWVKKRGVDVERLYQEQGSPVENLLPASRPLPLVVVDGHIALFGRYPTREEMGIWMMFGFVSADDGNASGIRCCTL